MRAVRKYRQWLLYSALGIPGILVPRFDYMGPNRVRYNLGWPISGMDILVGGSDDGRVLHFQPDPTLLVAIAFWVFVIGFALHARRWAIGCSDWRGAAIQSLLTSLYCVLTLWFLFGTTQVIWDWRLHSMQWPELENAYRFGRRWLPYLYALGAGGTLIVLLVDSLHRRSVLRLFHLACLVCMCYGLWRFSPYVEWQLKYLDESIEYGQKQQMQNR